MSYIRTDYSVFVEDPRIIDECESWIRFRQGEDPYSFLTMFLSNDKQQRLDQLSQLEEDLVVVITRLQAEIAGKPNPYTPPENDDSAEFHNEVAKRIADDEEVSF